MLAVLELEEMRNVTELFIFYCGGASPLFIPHLDSNAITVIEFLSPLPSSDKNLVSVHLHSAVGVKSNVGDPKGTIKTRLERKTAQGNG